MTIFARKRWQHSSCVGFIVLPHFYGHRLTINAFSVTVTSDCNEWLTHSLDLFFYLAESTNSDGAQTGFGCGDHAITVLSFESQQNDHDTELALHCSPFHVTVLRFSLLFALFKFQLFIGFRFNSCDSQAELENRIGFGFSNTAWHGMQWLISSLILSKKNWNNCTIALRYVIETMLTSCNE